VAGHEGFIATAYIRMLGLLLAGTFVLNGIVVAPLLVYGSQYWPPHWLLLARALDAVFVVTAGRTIWICAGRS
jgi:hypothetical protein